MKPSDLFDRCRVQGKRVTPIRRSVAILFSKARKPLSVEEIGCHLNRLGLKPNKTTLYREIGFLMESGCLHELDFGSGRKVYEWESEHHHHLVCRNCQAVEEIEVGELESAFGAFEKKLGRKSRFSSVSHSLEFYGVCNRCVTK